ncbi:MAG: SusD/RagB family nutrient-binding outer membrane lipoprotein [Bacteroidota bacterium]
MKFILKLRIIILMVLVAFATNACDDFDDINVNPTQAATVDPAFQLTRVQVTMSNNRYEYWRAQYIYCSTIIQHNACTFSYWSGDKYNRIDSYSSALWDVTYPREVKNLVDLISRTAEDPAMVNYNATARIVKAYVFQRLTDLYGDIPYFEAGKGFLDANYSPVYDSQQVIYTDLLKEITEATAALDDNARLTGDIWLGNDITKWRKWGNSLRLRLGMRLSEVDPGSAEREVRAAISGGVMTSIDDMPVMFHTDLERNGNTAVMQADDNFRLSNTLVDYLRDNGDPRLPIWGMVYDDAGAENPDWQNWVGLANGLDADDLEEGELATFPRHNRTTVKDVTAPYFHHSYAEVEYMLAEAALRGWGAPLSAAEHFENGLRGAVEQVTLYANSAIDAGTLDAFVAANPLNTGSFEESLEHISTEYWANQYLNAMEAFANWRRTGYPQLTAVDHPIGTTNGTIPRRLYYPPSELANNNANYLEAVSRQFGGEDELTGRVWWDAQ